MGYLKKNNSHSKYHGGLKNGAETWSVDGSSQGQSIEDVQSELNQEGRYIYLHGQQCFLGYMVIT